MDLREVDISPYEGLVFATSVRYAPILDEDLEDVQQILRLKVAQALVSFDPARATQKVEGYVFSCMRNRVKDLLKAQAHRNRVRGGPQLHIEDISRGSEHAFEARYRSESEEVAFAEVMDEAVVLPATLTDEEQAVIALLLQECSQVQVARALRLDPKKVRAIHASVREKMADWRPSSEADLATVVAI